MSKIIKTKWLVFTQCETPKRQITQRWEVSNKSGDFLARISWYTAWRQYCWMPVHGCVWNSECTDEVSHFVKQLNIEHKKK